MEFSILDALNTSFVTMIIVFSLLIILQYIIKFQSFILNLKIKRAQVNTVDIIDNEDETIVEDDFQDNFQDDFEVMAVIVAAISAYTDKPESNLRIKSIKRVNNNWI